MDVRVVESAPAEARLLEIERVREFVVVDWLLPQQIAGVSKTTSINLFYWRPFTMRCTRKSTLELANSMAREAYGESGAPLAGSS